MADNTTIDNSADIEQESSTDNSPSQPKTSESNIIEIRKVSEIGGKNRIIYDISVDGGQKRIFGWRIHEGSQVEISGSNLEIYDQINLHIAGGTYIHKGIDRQAGGRILSFTVSDEIKDLFAEGAQIELELVSSANSGNNRFLKQKFKYKGQTPEEKEQARKAKGLKDEALKAQAGKAKDRIGEFVGAAFGPVEAFGQGLASRPTSPAKPAQAVSGDNKLATKNISDKQQAEDNYDDGGGEAFEQASEVQNSSGQAFTATESSVGTQTVGVGSTIEQSQAGTATVSAGGTITGKESVTASAGATVKSSGTASVGGTVTTRGQEQTGATITGAQSVSSRGEISGTQSVSQSGTVSGGVDAKTSQTVSGTATGGGTVDTSQTVSTSGTIDESQTISGTTTGGAAASASQKVFTASEAKVSDEAKISSKVKMDEGVVEAPVTSEAKTSVSGQETTSEKAKSDATVAGEKEIEETAEIKSSGQEKVSGEIAETEKIEQKAEVKQPQTSESAPGKGKIDAVEKIPLPESPDEQSTTEKKSAQIKAPGSTASYGMGFGLSGGTPPITGGMSGTLGKFKANEAALDKRIGGGIGGRPSVKASDGLGRKISDKSSKVPVDTDGKSSDADKTKIDGQSAEKQKEKPLAGPLTAPPEQENLGANESPDSQSSAGEPSPQAGLPAEEKGKQAENFGQEQPEGEPEAEAGQGGGAGEQLSTVPQSQAPKALTSAELEEAEKLANKTVNTFLQGLAKIIWTSALPTFGLAILAGAIMGDLLWLLKDWAIKKALKATPLPDKFKNINLNEFKIKFSLSIKSQILAWNAIVVAAILVILIFVFAILWGLCNSWVTYPVREMGLQPVCEAIDKSSMGQGLNNFKSTGSFSASYNTPGSLIGTAQWTSQINTSAQKWNIDACILRVVVQKESGGNQSAIGCDCAANGHPEYCPDKRKTYATDYQFNWNQCSYGIGLTQWTIYPKGGSGYKAWQDVNTPSRNLYSSWYKVPDLLNGQTSLDLTAQAFSANLGKANGDVAAAFAAYVGASSIQNKLVADRMALYNMCKSGN